MSSANGTSKCATETQMITRQALLFRSNVYVNNLIALATVVLTYKVLRKMSKKTYFSNSTHVLIWVSLLIVNLHGLIYGYIQNWSLYRSFVYSTEPCQIMFTEYECFSSYTVNIFIRLLLLFTNCALTLDRLLTLVVPCIPPSYARGIVLFLISLAGAVGFCSDLTSDGPTDSLQSNCFQRMNRNVDELKEQVLFYFKACMLCLILNMLTWFFSWRSLRTNRFNLEEQYSKRENLNSAMVISFILVFQTIALGFYSLSVVYIVDIYEFVDKIVMTNLVLWFYTYPWASLSFPFGILISTRYISVRRRQQVGVMLDGAGKTKENTTSYFVQLQQAWDSELTPESQAQWDRNPSSGKDIPSTIRNEDKVKK